MTKYYAVANGRERGIFTDWATVKDLISGYSGAIYKSFPSRELAERFLSVNNQEPNHTISVYTDGSFKDGRGGYGVLVIRANGEIRRYCGRVPGTHVTNNVAELYAILTALTIVKEDFDLYTDSNYSIGVLNGNEVNTNRKLVDEIKNLLKNRNVTMIHIDGHSGHQYNEEADKLADHGRMSEEKIIVI